MADRKYGLQQEDKYNGISQPAYSLAEENTRYAT
jgi:hypothetical protein